MHDTRQETKESYEAERMALVAANQELEKKLTKYKAQIRELKSKQQPQLPPQLEREDAADELFDVLPRAQLTSSPEAGAELDDNLEDSMRKVMWMLRLPLLESLSTSISVAQ